MKTLRLLSIVSLVLTGVSVSLAGPGPQYWQIRASSAKQTPPKEEASRKPDTRVERGSCECCACCKVD